MKTATATPNILLIDDNRDGLLVRRLLLEELGFRVAVASSADEGLKEFQSQTFDVVVTDYRMPRMNGIELIARIRQINALARVVLLSGFVDPLGLNEENTGADAVIAKSATEPAQLTRAIKKLVNRPPGRKPPARQKSSATTRSRASGR